MVLARKEKERFYQLVKYKANVSCRGGLPHTQQKALSQTDAEEAEKLLKERNYEVILAELPHTLDPTESIDLDKILYQETIKEVIDKK